MALESRECALPIQAYLRCQLELPVGASAAPLPSPSAISLHRLLMPLFGARGTKDAHMKADVNRIENSCKPSTATLTGIGCGSTAQPVGT